MRTLAVLALAALAGCGGTIEMATPFDAREVAYVTRSGAADVTGQAFFRQRGGGVVTCAGEEVALIPAGAYMREFVTKGFGRVEGGTIPAIMAPQVSHPPEFAQYRRTATCDAEGDFEFRNVANGDYYVTSIVLWTVGDQIIPEGGALAKLVQIRGGRDQRVIVS
ncbi:hypothetical protein DXV76_02755 [Rhodobacteraceae bacterium CCMM004]|nr:hypothetical protein DXV76_02755 [Rhodobacteraceae bacterium CCMM004]